MASLKEIVKCCHNEIVDGATWVIIWKEGRSWNACINREDDGDTETGLIFATDEVEYLEKIASTDPKAIFLNGIFCRIPYESTDAEIIDIVRRYYETRRYQLRGDFLGGLVAEVSQ